MPSSERIETLISPEALKQFDQLKASADANVASFEKLVSKAVELNKTLANASSYKEITKATKEVEETDQKLISAHEAVIKAQEKLKKSSADIGDSFANVGAKINAQLGGNTENTIEKLLKLNDALKATKKAQQELQGQKDILSGLDKSLPEVAAGLKQIIEREKELKTEELILKKNISDTNTEIKKRLNLELITPGTRLEIKNTIDSLKQLRDTQIDINTEQGQAQVAELNEEIDRLSKIYEQTSDKLEKRKINIGNYPGAVKILEQSLIEVNKRIDDFTSSGNQSKEMLEALTKEQLLLQTLVDKQSEGFRNATAAIKGNEQAIQALSQVYGEDSEVVQNLIAETGRLKDEVGDLRARIKAQASDTKVFDGLIDAATGLTAVYSIAQGAAALFGDENEELQKTFVKLQAVMAVLQGLQAIQNVLQKESAARQLINIGLQKAAVLQTSLQTATESKNIVTRYAAIIAQKALNLAMSAAGGPILAVIGIITLLVLSLKTFAAQATATAKSIEQLSAEFERDVKAVDNYNESVKQLGDEAVADLERNFASEKQIRDQRSKNLREQFRATFDLEQQYARDVEIQRRKLVKTLKKNTDDLTEEDKKQLDQQDQLIQKFKDVQQKRAALASQIRVGSSQNERATTVDNIKARQDDIDAFKLQLQTRLQLQQSIAGNERKTQEERIAALKESARIQREIINSDANKQLLTPGQTPTQIKLIESQRTASLTQARRDSNKAIEDINRSYAERERKARFDIIRTEIEDQIKADDLIVQNDKNSFDKRLDALYDGYEKRRDIIIAQHDLDIQNDTLTAEERLAIEKKYISDINGITVEYGLQQQALYQDNQDKVNDIIEKGQKARQDKIAGDAAGANTELINQLVAGQITLEQYNKRREENEHNARIESLKEEVNAATAKVLATKEGTVERFEAEKELKEKGLALTEEYNKKEIDAITKLNEVKKQIAYEAFDTFTSIINSQYDNEANRVQQALDDLDKQKEKEISIADQTILNKQQKEVEIAKIEARAQAQREVLERRQRQIQLERARFEKAANIARIISDTAVAVVSALGTRPFTPANIALAAAVGTLGALQLAKAIAAPLPKFAEGTTDAPGGLAWVGDGGKRELVITPQGHVTQTPSVPAVMNVPRHSIVLPDARAALESGLAVNRHGRLVPQDNGNIKIEQKLDNIAKVIKNKPVLNMSANESGLTAMWNYGANWISYIEDQTRY